VGDAVYFKNGLSNRKVGHGGGAQRIGVHATLWTMETNLSPKEIIEL